jgi:hypothetical protein
MVEFERMRLEFHSLWNPVNKYPLGMPLKNLTPGRVYEEKISKNNHLKRCPELIYIEKEPKICMVC